MQLFCASCRNLFFEYDKIEKCRSYCNKFAYSWKIHPLFIKLFFVPFSQKFFSSISFPFNQTASRNKRLKTGWCTMHLRAHALDSKKFWYRIPNRYFIRGSIKHPTDRKFFFSFFWWKDGRFLRFNCNFFEDILPDPIA